MRWMLMIALAGLVGYASAEAKTSATQKANKYMQDPAFREAVLEVLRTEKHLKVDILSAESLSANHLSAEGVYVSGNLSAKGATISDSFSVGTSVLIGVGQIYFRGKNGANLSIGHHETTRTDPTTGATHDTTWPAAIMFWDPKTKKTKRIITP